MKRPYFDHNGNRYYKGTVMSVIGGFGNNEIVTFQFFDTDTNMYVYRRGICDCHVFEKNFFKNIIEIIEPKSLEDLTAATWGNNNMSVYEVINAVGKGSTVKDSQIDGLPTGWVWYIILMLLSTVFHDRVGVWILISVVFFGWRYAKKKKSGN